MKSKVEQLKTQARLHQKGNDRSAILTIHIDILFEIKMGLIDKDCPYIYIYMLDLATKNYICCTSLDNKINI